MKYSAAVGAGIGGLMRQILGQSVGNGALDAAKALEAESTVGLNNSTIALNQGKTARQQAQQRLFTDSNLAREISMRMNGLDPTAVNVSPQQNSQVNRGMGALAAQYALTGDSDLGDLSSTLKSLLARGDYEQAAIGGDPAMSHYNGMQAAEAGKLYSSVGDSGLTLSQAGGNQAIGNPQQFNSQLGKTIAEVALKKAQTGQANSAAQLSQARINQPQNAVAYDAAGNMVLVDKRTAQSRPVTGPDGSPITGKPVRLPPNAMKMQQENVEAIGAAAGINATIEKIEQQIDAGKLYFSPASRLTSAIRNNTNSSDELSRNMASFQSTLEKLRNDSLRLNTGVQTDGDAKRAWNELVTNINDTELVRQRLAEIKEINARAVQLRKLQIEQLRQNFGANQLGNYGDAIESPATEVDWNSLPD